MADNGQKMPGIGEPEQKQKRLFKYKRAGVELSENEVREIKAGRKRLRADLRAAGIKSKKDFDLTASSLGLYFDKRRFLAFLAWLLHGRQLLALLGALLLLLTLLWGMSLVSQMRGHFTINLTDELFDQGLAVGIELTEDKDKLKNPTNYLFSVPLEDAPCTSITCIPADIHEFEGIHNTEDYFAYTFYIRNEGDMTVGYDYQLEISSESKNLSSAAWVMMIRDGEMTFYAEANADGTPEILPEVGARSPETGKLLGFREHKLPLMAMARYPDEQFQIIEESKNSVPAYRLVPIPFESEYVVASGREENVEPGEYHKYTIVLWLEGDDPDCTNELIGGHLGLEMNFTLVDTNKDEGKETK